MKRLNIVLALFAGFLMIATMGCQKDEITGDTTGKLIIKVTDAPFPIDTIESAVVTITKVEVRNQEDTAGYPFLTLMEDSIEFNLLELRNGVTAELVDHELPVGTYDLVRLYVDKASLKIKEGDTYHVKVPSGQQTGIKIFIDPPFRIEGGLVTELLLDFSLEKSFVLKGNMNTPAGINGFNFKPVIRAVNNTTAGVLAGTVSDTAMMALKSASVWIEKDSVIATAFTDSTGFYSILGIPEGFYSVYASKENYDTVMVEDLEIVAGNQTTQDFVLTPLP